MFGLVAAAALLTKYLIRYRGSHVFNPSNVGLVAAFVILGSTRVGTSRLLVGARSTAGWRPADMTSWPAAS